MPLAPRLASLSADHLRALVHRLVTRHPDLEGLVHLPLPGEEPRADPEAIRALVMKILLEMGDDWRASSRAQSDLDPIVDLGDSYRAAGRFEAARSVYRAVIDGILALYEQIRDEESEVGNIVGECVEGLGACIDGTDDDALRKRLIRDVFSVYRWDAIDHGGYGMDGPALKVLLSSSSDAEKAEIASWAGEAVASAGPNPSIWRRRAVGNLILDLIGDRLDRRERELLFAQAGMAKELIELLLSAGRTGEAVAALRLAEVGELVRLGDRLVAAGLADEATEVINRTGLGVLCTT